MPKEQDEFFKKFAGFAPDFGDPFSEENMQKEPEERSGDFTGLVVAALKATIEELEKNE